MKKSTKIIIIVASVLAALIIGSCVWFFISYANVGGQFVNTGVTHLDLSDRSLTEVNNLSRLDKLEELDLSGNPMENYAGLMDCKSLRSLNLCDCGLSPEQYDTLHEALPECKILWEIEILGETYMSDVNSITLASDDISELRKITYLTDLDRAYLTGCEVEDEQLYEIAEQLPDTAVVWEVELSKSKSLPTDTEVIEKYVSSYGLEKLRYFTQAKELDVTVNGEDDITPIAEMRSLDDLYLCCREDVDLAPLANAPVLTHLDLQNCKVADLEWAADMTRLTFLYVRDERITDLAPLSGLVNMEQLCIGACGITDLSPIASMTKMRNLVIGANDITDISVLGNMPDLELLNANSCPNVRDFSVLSELTKLKNLQVSGCNISDISWVEGLTELELLLLSEDPIEDLSPLSRLTKMDTLSLSYIGKVDLSAIEPLTNLTCLFLDGDEIDDLSPLYSMSKMSQITFVDAKIPGGQKSELKKSLPDDCAIIYRWQDYFI